MIEIRQNADGSIDEVISPFACCNVHLESLGDGNWSLVLSAMGDIEHIAHVTITPKRAFVYESTNCKVICTDKPLTPPTERAAMTCKHLMRDAADCVFCERDRLKAELHRIRNQSLKWAMTCPHDCPACEAMYEAIKSTERT